MDIAGKDILVLGGHGLVVKLPLLAPGLQRYRQALHIDSFPGDAEWTLGVLLHRARTAH